jgi:hypothetical protein
LEDLFPSAQARRGTGGELEMPARLRAERPCFQTRSKGTGEAAFDYLRAGGTFRSAIAPPHSFVIGGMQTFVKPVVLFWAIVRIILGIAQMTGAVVSVAFLFRFGAARETLMAVSITMGVTVLSIILFRFLKVQGKEHSKNPFAKKPGES